MKKVLALCIGVLLFASCEQDTLVPEIEETLVPEIEEINIDQTTFARVGGVAVCHKNAGEIVIGEAAVQTHIDHGDAVDVDGDGFYDRENPCSEVDLDDSIHFDQSVLIDEDGDGFFTTENPFSEIDCDDSDATVNPDATEVCDNGIDDNCDGDVDEGCSACSEYDWAGFLNLVDDSGCWVYYGGTNGATIYSYCGNNFLHVASNGDWYMKMEGTDSLGTSPLESLQCLLDFIVENGIPHEE